MPHIHILKKEEISNTTSIAEEIFQVLLQRKSIYGTRSLHQNKQRGFLTCTGILGGLGGL